MNTKICYAIWLLHATFGIIANNQQSTKPGQPIFLPKMHPSYLWPTFALSSTRCDGTMKGLIEITTCLDRHLLYHHLSGCNTNFQYKYPCSVSREIHWLALCLTLVLRACHYSLSSVGWSISTLIAAIERGLAALTQ